MAEQRGQYHSVPSGTVSGPTRTHSPWNHVAHWSQAIINLP
jgi:hypothetical protein